MTADDQVFQAGPIGDHDPAAEKINHALSFKVVQDQGRRLACAANDVRQFLMGQLALERLPASAGATRTICRPISASRRWKLPAARW